MSLNFKTGIGFDVHAFAENRKLILGGIEIPYDKGLAGHSDADVLLHAIADAMLGALALGDIGKHFPDTDEKYKDSNSSQLLEEVNKLIIKRGYKTGNVDSVIAIQKPKLAPYINGMRKRISEILDVEIENVSVKATTTENLGFVGREEGVSVMASVLIFKNEKL